MVWFPPPYELPNVDLLEMRELRLLFDGKAEVKDCPALIALAGNAASLRDDLHWITAFGRNSVLRFPKLMPKRKPYISPQYCAAFGEMLRIGSPDDFAMQLPNAMLPETFQRQRTGMKGTRDYWRLRAAIWFGMTSEKFTRDHRDDMLGHMLVELRGQSSLRPPVEKELHPLLAAAGLVLLWGGLFLAISLGWPTHEQLSIWDLAWSAF